MFLWLKRVKACAIAAFIAVPISLLGDSIISTSKTEQITDGTIYFLGMGAVETGDKEAIKFNVTSVSDDLKIYAYRKYGANPTLMSTYAGDVRGPALSVYADYAVSAAPCGATLRIYNDYGGDMFFTSIGAASTTVFSITRKPGDVIPSYEYFFIDPGNSSGATFESRVLSVNTALNSAGSVSVFGNYEPASVGANPRIDKNWVFGRFGSQNTFVADINVSGLETNTAASVVFGTKSPRNDNAVAIDNWVFAGFGNENVFRSTAKQNNTPNPAHAHATVFGINDMIVASAESAESASQWTIGRFGDQSVLVSSATALGQAQASAAIFGATRIPDATSTNILCQNWSVEFGGSAALMATAYAAGQGAPVAYTNVLGGVSNKNMRYYFNDLDVADGSSPTVTIAGFLAENPPEGGAQTIHTIQNRNPLAIRLGENTQVNVGRTRVMVDDWEKEGKDLAKGPPTGEGTQKDSPQVSANTETWASTAAFSANTQETLWNTDTTWETNKSIGMGGSIWPDGWEAGGRRVGPGTLNIFGHIACDNTAISYKSITNYAPGACMRIDNGWTVNCFASVCDFQTIEILNGELCLRSPHDFSAYGAAIEQLHGKNSNFDVWQNVYPINGQLVVCGTDRSSISDNAWLHGLDYNNSSKPFPDLRPRLVFGCVHGFNSGQYPGYSSTGRIVLTGLGASSYDWQMNICGGAVFALRLLDAADLSTPMESPGDGHVNAFVIYMKNLTEDKTLTITEKHTRMLNLIKFNGSTLGSFGSEIPYETAPGETDDDQHSHFYFLDEYGTATQGLSYSLLQRPTNTRKDPYTFGFTNTLAKQYVVWTDRNGKLGLSIVYLNESGKISYADISTESVFVGDIDEPASEPPAGCNCEPGMQGEPGPTGPAGPTGPEGPAGTPADNEAIAIALAGNNDFKSDLADTIADDQDLRDAVKEGLASDVGFQVAVASDLKSDPDFQLAVKGETGARGSDGAAGAPGADANNVTIAGLLAVNSDFQAAVASDEGLRTAVAGNEELQAAVAGTVADNETFQAAVEVKLAFDSGFQSDIAGNEVLQTAVARDLKSDDPFLSNLADAIADDPDFQSDVASDLKSDEVFQAAVKGKDGTNGSDADPAVVATKLAENDEFKAVLADAIADDPDLRDAVKEGLASDGSFQGAVASDLKSDPDFQLAVKGETGARGSDGAAGAPGADANNVTIAGLLAVNSDFQAAVASDEGLRTAVAGNEELQAAVAGTVADNETFQAAVELKLASDSGFQADIAGNEVLQTAVASDLKSDDPFLSNLADAIADDPDFQSDVASDLKSDEAFQEAVKGKDGTNGSDADPAVVATKLAENDEFKAVLADAIADNQDLRDAVKEGLASDGSFQGAVASDLKSDEAFQEAVKGETGAQGAAGATASEVAMVLKFDDSFKSELAGAIAESETFQAAVEVKLASDSGFQADIAGNEVLQIAVATDLKSDDPFLSNLADAIANDPNFQSDVASDLKSDTDFQAAVKGETGARGSDGAAGAPGADANNETIAALLVDNSNFQAAVASDEGLRTAVAGNSNLQIAVAGTVADSETFQAAVEVKLASDSGFQSDIAGNAVLQTAVASDLKSDELFLSNLADAIADDPGFQSDVASDLKSDEVFQAAVKGKDGEPGAAGAGADNEVIAAALATNSDFQAAVASDEGLRIAVAGNSNLQIAVAGTVADSETFQAAVEVKLASDSSFQADIAGNEVLQIAVATDLKSDDPFLSNLADAIANDPDFQSDVASDLKSDEVFQAAVKGKDGTNGSDADPAVVATKLAENDEFKAVLADAIADDPDLRDAVKEGLASDGSFQGAVASDGAFQEAVAGNSDLQDAVAGTLAGNSNFQTAVASDSDLRTTVKEGLASDGSFQGAVKGKLASDVGFQAAVKGDPGAAGASASDVAATLKGDPDFKSGLASEVADNPDLQNAVADNQNLKTGLASNKALQAAVAGDKVLQVAVKGELATNEEFQTAIASDLKDDPTFQEAVKGADGEQGAGADPEAVATALAANIAFQSEVADNTALQAAVATNTALRTAVAGNLKNDLDFQAAVKGDTGDGGTTYASPSFAALPPMNRVCLSRNVMRAKRTCMFKMLQAIDQRAYDIKGNGDPFILIFGGREHCDVDESNLGSSSHFYGTFLGEDWNRHVSNNFSICYGFGLGHVRSRSDFHGSLAEDFHGATCQETAGSAFISGEFYNEKCQKTNLGAMLAVNAGSTKVLRFDGKPEKFDDMSFHGKITGAHELFRVKGVRIGPKLDLRYTFFRANVYALPSTHTDQQQFNAYLEEMFDADARDGFSPTDLSTLYTAYRNSRSVPAVSNHMADLVLGLNFEKEMDGDRYDARPLKLQCDLGWQRQVMRKMSSIPTIYGKIQSAFSLDMGNGPNDFFVYSGSFRKCLLSHWEIRGQLSGAHGEKYNCHSANLSLGYEF